MKKASGWLWGGVLMALGVILGINALEIANINIFFPGWWTLFIIVPCAIGMFTDEHKGGPMIGLVVGICLLLSCLGVLPFGTFWKLLLPGLLVVIGLAVIMRSTRNGDVADRIKKAEARERKKSGHIVMEGEVVDEDTKGEKEDVENEEYWSTFSDQDVNYNGKTFTGCKVEAVFGGADIDLRGAKIKDEAVLKTSSLFGEIIVYVPDDVEVEVAATSIFGGVADKRKNVGKGKSSDDADKSSKKKTLYIDATCVFGGVELR